MNFLFGYISTLVVLAIIDAAWLFTMADRIYRPVIGELLVEKFRPAPAIIFYLLFCLGVTLFATLPGMKSGDWKTAALWGGLFGFFCYATYDLTNQATLKVWATKITLIDLAWGTFLCATSATLAAMLANRLLKLVA